ncbi:ADP-ribosylglycohydrolase family protein [Streptomyces sp. NPDC048523]|uniref:ADP-ribosylglycohydrolase family protein n=1 Tax=Streptomyces sp. NPDC048523 TaxID=3365567 RepID=UPI003724C16D
MRPPGPWAEPPAPTPTASDSAPTAPPNAEDATTRPTTSATTALRTTSASTAAPPTSEPTALLTTLGPAEPALTATVAQPAPADGEFAPLGPPAPDDESCTGGAGGNTKAEGEAEAGAGQRVHGLLLGLAAGDAAGWPAARHRAARMPEWTRRLTRELDTFAEQNATTTLPVPIALNQPPEPLRLGPSDDAEWAAFTAEALLRAGDDTALGDLTRERRTRAAIDLTWNALAGEVAAAADRAPEIESADIPLRARISVRAGLGNLATGLRPPATGHDNPHYFDDAACIRACVLAVAHPGAPRPAADLAEFDARYTQDGDGVHGARAMAAAVSLALIGAPVEACVTAALTELPAETEIGRNARHALRLAEAAGNAFALIPVLEHEIVDHVYSYGVAAAETVPVALALATAAQGRIAEAVPAAACLSRVADSAPALTGALTGALGGAAAIPASWRDTCRTLSGCALPRLTGTDLVELAELLVAAQPPLPGG